MNNQDEKSTPVRTKAALIDPASMTVLWMNEPAAQDLPSELMGSYQGSYIEIAIPMAKVLGLKEALATVSETGESRHLQADLISSKRGKMATIASVYRLPDGKLLFLTEIGWQVKSGRSGYQGTRSYLDLDR